LENVTVLIQNDMLLEFLFYECCGDDVWEGIMAC